MLYGIFLLLNVALAWLAFFRKDSTPDTLLTLVLGVGGLVDVMSAVITLTEKRNERSNKDETLQ